MDKNKIRKLYKARRKNVSDRSIKEKKIAEKLLRELRCAKSVFIYQSIGGEVSTSAIIDEIKNNKKVYVPEVCGTEMKLAGIDGGYADKPCDVTVVPLIAFNETLDRVGFGGGYYDRYLSRNSTKSIGIAFDEQQCDEIKTEPTDMALDMIITPTRILEKRCE